MTIFTVEKIIFLRFLIAVICPKTFGRTIRLSHTSVIGHAPVKALFYSMQIHN